MCGNRYDVNNADVTLKFNLIDVTYIFFTFRETQAVDTNRLNVEANKED